jgi:hypothetical protein
MGRGLREEGFKRALHIGIGKVLCLLRILSACHKRIERRLPIIGGEESSRLAIGRNIIRAHNPLQLALPAQVIGRQVPMLTAAINAWYNNEHIAFGRQFNRVTI